jgi:hypothetical protein
MRVLPLIVSLLFWAAPRVALSESVTTENVDSKSEARRYFQAGVALQKTDDFGAAIEAYATSLGLYRTKSALFNLANCQRAMHLYAEAWSSLHQLHEQFGPELEEPMLSTSKAQLEELENLTGLVRVESQPMGAEIAVDGKPAGTTPIEPALRLAIGQHTVTASLVGYGVAEQNFKLSPRQALAVALELTPLPEPKRDSVLVDQPSTPPAPASIKTQPPTVIPAQPSAAWTIAGWAGVALGAAGVAVGARAGVLALQVDERLTDVCSAGHCSPRYSADIERLERLSLSANVFVGAGALFLAAGVTLLLWPASEPAEQLKIAVSPTGLQLGGRF